MCLFLCLRAMGLWVRAATAAVAAGGDAAVAVLNERHVVDSSPAAIRAGVRLGMTRREALRHCPDLHIRQLASDDPRLLALWDIICRKIYALTPQLEVLAPGTLLFTFTTAQGGRQGTGGPHRLPGVANAATPAKRGGAASLHESPAPLGESLAPLGERLCPAVADRLLVGCAGSAFVARLLADRLAAGEPTPGASRLHLAEGRLVLAALPPGREAALLDGLPIGALWPLAEAVRAELERLGFATLRDLRRAGRQALAAALGRDGARAWELATGNDGTSLAVNYPPPEVAVTAPAAEQAAELATPQQLVDAALAAAGTLAAALHRQGLAARSLWLHVQGGRALATLRRFSRPRSEPGSLREAARALVQTALTRSTPTGSDEALFPIDRLLLVARDLVPRAAVQESLWPAAASLKARHSRAREAVAHLRRRFPERAIRLGAALELSWRERQLAYWDPLRLACRPPAARGAP